MTERPPPEGAPSAEASHARASPRETFANVARAARLIHRAAPGWTEAAIALNAVEALVPVASALALKALTDAAVAAANGNGASGAVILAAAVTAGLALAGHVAEAVLYRVRDVQQALVDLRFQSLVQERSAAVDLARTEEPAFHDTLHLAQREVASRPQNIVANLLSLLQNALALGGMALLLAGLHWSLPFLIVAVSIPEFLVRFSVTEAMHRFHGDHVEQERRARAFADFLMLPGFAKELRLNALAQPFAEAFRALRRAILADRKVVVAARVRLMILAKVPPVVALFGVMVFLADRVAVRALTVGDMVLFLAAFQQGQSSLRALLRDVAALHEDGLFLGHFLRVLEMRPAIVDPASPAVLRFGTPPALRLEGVSFAYPATGRPVLDAIDLDLPAGATIALVGRNGAGKTTLTKLLTRLYEPDRGRILFDGRPLADYRLADLHRAMAVVCQDFARYPLTLRENVALGAPWRDDTPDAVRAALRLAGAESLEARLARGLDTTLTRAMRGGTDLSLGEWQKVALARAQFREAGLMILDEPTSAMDARAEAEVMARLTETARGRTLLMITHRLSAVRHADRIHVLDGGRIVESGDHDTLIRAGGLYAHLFEIQARAYRDDDA